MRSISVINARARFGLSRAIRHALFGTSVVAAGWGGAVFAETLESVESSQSSDSSATLELSNVVVTASAGGVEQDVKQAPASISVVTHETLESKPFRDLADALSTVPGVVTSVGGDHKEINIRGMSSDYTLTLIDGKRIDSRDTGRLFDSYGQTNAWTPPVSAIERIEVVRGPMSALYGSDAMGGVINIITRKVAKVWSGEIGTDATFQAHSRSGDIFQNNFFLTGPIKEDLLGLQLYGQYSDRDEDHVYNGYRGSKRDNLTAKLALTPSPDHDLILEASHARQRIESRVGNSISPECTSYSGCPSDYDKETEVDRFSLTHNGRWDFATSESYIQQEQYNVPGWHINLKNIDARTSWALPLGEHVLTLGSGFNRKELHDGYSNQVSDLTDIDRTEKSFFVEDVWYLLDDFSLTTGLRLDDDDQFGKHWSPRIYGVWTLSPEWTIKGGVTSGFKAPSITEIAPNFGSVSYLGDVYGNADLKPEKSINQEIGIAYSRDDLSASLTLFNNQFDDKINTVACGAAQCAQVPNQYGGYPLTYENVAKAVTRGVEASLSVPLRGSLSLDNNYTYTYSRQESGLYAGKPLNKLPLHVFSSTLNYKPTESMTQWTRLTYRGKDSQNVGGAMQTIMPVEAPSYTVLDAGATYQMTKKLSLRGGVYNLADKRIGYDDYGFVEDGRRYWLGMTLKF